MKVFSLEILSPEGRIFRDIVTEVNVPTTTGEITILPGHAPLFTKLAGGEVLIRKENKDSYITITGGFLEVSENKVNILADYAIRSEQIETDAIEEAKRNAEDTIRKMKDKAGLADMEKDLRRYALELKISEKSRKRTRKHI